MFEGFVLRKPRIAPSNNPVTSDPDVLVLNRDSNLSGTSDRDDYLTTFIDDPSAGGREYLIVPAATSNLVVGTSLIQENPEVIDDAGKVYQFNREGLAIQDFNVVLGDAPDRIDIEAGLLIYDSVPVVPPTVQYRKQALSLYYTRNDEDLQRFGYDDRVNRWRTLPGSTPDLLGTVPEDPLTPLTLALAEPSQGAPRLVLGSLDNPAIPVSYVLSEALWQDYLDGVTTPPAGEAVAYAETGDLLLAPDLISTYINQNAYQYRYSFYAFDASNGYLGVVGEEDLYLNPVPNAGERPLLRDKHGSFLKVARSTDPVGDEAVRWDATSGKLTFTDTSLEGCRFYYEGVYSVDTPIFAFPPTDLGTITSSFTSTTGISNIDASVYDREALLLYVKETGRVIPNLIWEEDPRDFPLPGKIPENTAHVYYDEGADEVQIQLSYAFMRAQEGNTLSVGTGDFYIDDGITFRMSPSLLDPVNEGVYPDARSRVRVSNEVLIESINPGPFAILPQLPLQDIGGYSEDVFFQIQSGSSTRTLIPDEDVVYDFDNFQIKWAQRESQTQNITQEASSVKLPHEVLLDRNFTFELDTGSGFTALEPGETVVVDYDLGSIAFAEPSGKTLYTGFGDLTGDTLTDATASFDFAADIGSSPGALDASRRPILIIKGTSEVYRIDSSTSTTLTLATNAITPGANLEYEVIEGPDIAFEYTFEDVSLTKRRVFPYVFLDLDTSSSSLYVPDGEDYVFKSDDVPVASVLLEENLLGFSTETLTIPPYFLNATSNFTLYRDAQDLTFVPGVPSNPNEYTYDGVSGDITLYVGDVTAYPNGRIYLVPALSTGRATGPVEVLRSDRSLGLPDDLVGEPLAVGTLLREDQYTVQPSNGVLFFQSAFRNGSRLEVAYYIDADTQITEEVSFRAREVLTVSAGDTGATFSSGVVLDTTKPARVFINGAPTPNVTVDLTAKTVSFPAPVKAGRTYEIEYYRVQSLGGEKTGTLKQSVFNPPVSIRSGSSTQTFYGDHTSSLPVQGVLLVDDLSFLIQSVSYDSGLDVTTVDLYPNPLEDVNNPTTVRVSNLPITRRVTLSAALEETSLGDQEVRLFGDFTDALFPDHILYLDGAPYTIVSASWDFQASLTRVTLAQRLQGGYSNPTVQVSEEPVYEVSPSLLSVNRSLFSGQDVKLIALEEDGSGILLERGVAYEALDSGSVALDETNVSLPTSGQRWVLSYLARTDIGPYTSVTGQVIIPRLRSSYTRFIAATEETFAGAQLRAQYSFNSPDTFYFRAVPLEDFALEVREDLALAGSSGTSGPPTSFQSTQALHEKGSLTLIGEEVDLLDKDRVARRFLESYNDVAQGFESYLQALDGRVVGDQSGQFKFFIADDDQPGGEDPVTGELLPYYANPDGSGSKPTPSQIKDMDPLKQEGFIRNAIDDYVLVTRKPFNIDFDFPFELVFEFEGTFRRSWEPSKISRFYPQRSNAVTITPPDLGGDGSYAFFEDFGQVLGDLNTDNILSIEAVNERPPKGWLINDNVMIAGSEATINVGMVFNLGDTEASNPGNVTNALPNLTRGDASQYLPGFAVDQIVNLGRVEYEKDPITGIVERKVTVYAENMVVTNVSGDTVTLGRLDQSFFDSLYPDADIVFGDLEMTVTDPATLAGGSPALGYDAATSTPRQNDTLFGTTRNPLRQGFDFGLDASEGELINRALPDFLSKITGQSAPEPLTYLEATIIYKNSRTEPYRFPALDGESLDDDGLIGAPYGFPLLDSENVSFGNEEAAILSVLTGTTEGILEEADYVDDSTLRIPLDLTDPNLYPQPPRAYDLILFEGFTAGGGPATGGSTPHTFSEAISNAFKLASFQAYQDPVSYRVEDAFTGTGTGAGTTWTDDLSRDFTVLNGLSGTLYVSGTPYTVAVFGNGFIQVTTPLPASGPFTLEVSSSSGVIDSLHELKDPGVDFSWASGLDLEILSGVNTGTYTIASGTLGVMEFVTTPSGFVSAPVAMLTSSIEVQGSGSRNGIDPQVFDVTGTDFTPYAPNSTLNILVENINGDVESVSRYDVSSWNVNSVTVTSHIAEAGSVEFYLTGDDLFSVGDAAVDLGTDLRTLFVLTDLSNQDLQVGDTLIIGPDSANGGRYTVVNRDLSASPYVTVTLDRDLYTSEGDITNGDPLLDDFPLRFVTYRPRRFSLQLDNLRESQLQRRVLYDAVANAPTSPVDIQDLLVTGGYEAKNPSAPSLPILRGLLQDSFGDPISEASDGEVLDLGGGTFALRSITSDFNSAGVRDDLEGSASYVLVEEGFARGFYRVSEVTSSEQITLRDGSEFSVNFTGGLTAGSGVTFKIFNGDLFSDRTNELILYELVNVLEVLERLDAGVIATIHDPNSFISVGPISANPGEPSDATLNNHLTGSYSLLPVGIQDRRDFINISPGLVDEIEAVLKGTERLYDLRFSWIDYRVNLEYGTLFNQERLRSQRQKRKAERLRNLLRMIT